MQNHSTTPRGSLFMKAIRMPKRPRIASLRDAVRHGSPSTFIPFFDREAAIRRAWQRENAANFERSLADQESFAAGELRAIGHLWLRKIGAGGVVQDYGLASCRVVTTVGMGYVVDAFQNLVELENMKYHGLGTGSTAEAAGDTSLVTELTTQYASSNTRPTGTTGEKSATPNAYETSATITVSATVAATEHGIFSQASTGGGVLLDRSVFSVVNLASSESLQATYQLTFPAGS